MVQLRSCSANTHITNIYHPYYQLGNARFLFSSGFAAFLSASSEKKRKSTRSVFAMTTKGVIWHCWFWCFGDQFWDSRWNKWQVLDLFWVFWTWWGSWWCAALSPSQDTTIGIIKCNRLELEQLDCHLCHSEQTRRSAGSRSKDNPICSFFF